MTNSKRKKKAEKKAKKLTAKADSQKVSQVTAPLPEQQPRSVTDELAIAVPKSLDVSNSIHQVEHTPCASSEDQPLVTLASQVFARGAPSPQPSQTSDYHPEVSEDKLVEALQHHLVVEEDNDTDSTRTTEAVVAPETVAPIPYHLQGAHVTSDIYKMSNELSQKPLLRSKSTADMREQAEQVRQIDDPVLENVGRPGGFRRYYVDQQQQRQIETDGQEISQVVINGATQVAGSNYGTISSSSPPPIRRTRHFLEFLAVSQYRNMYDSFAGEYLADEEEGEVDEEAAIGRPPLERMPLLGRKHSFIAEKDKASTTKTFFLLLKAVSRLW
jgi:hypothetical protein